ncbi:hypothetical protein LCGC14_0478180 [marine sediment metagenome]|uniref:Uncharacterized protein n=1 Tax=marine sediment metagenome TaxID=412755 RepID=A0A0F9VIY4_9ZZZZ
MIEEALVALGASVTGWATRVETKMGRTNRKVNEHEVALGKIPAEIRVAILESEERTGEKIADLKETVLLKCGRDD